MSEKNIFVIALDDFNRRKLEALRVAQECRFHRLLSDEALSGERGYDIKRMLREGEAELEGFEGSVDGIIAYRDFPESTIQPILAERFGVPSASLEAVLKCEHKYWSRVEQQKAIPEHTPRFVRFHPFDPDARAQIDIPYPFWMKPVKSFASYLGFRIDNDDAFNRALELTRKEVRRLSEPFDRVLERVGIPEEIGQVGEVYCLAEQIARGHQCTLEGCRSGGRMMTLGVVDSVRVPGGSSFQRYQYPSRLPREVQMRMERAARQVVEQIGYDNACFNIEFFWDEQEDQLWFLEINGRIALHHADLFEKVDGYSNYEMAVDVALGREPSPSKGEGSFACAATYFLREFEDGRVKKAPSRDEVQRIEQSVPGSLIELRVKPGMKLSDMVEQDAYSYAMALIYVGGRDEEELQSKYQQVVDKLAIEIERSGSS